MTLRDKIALDLAVAMIARGDANDRVLGEAFKMADHFLEHSARKQTEELADFAVFASRIPLASSRGMTRD